ncbi:hypothetical protein J4218_03725 [Candidatus Pacearchaeota archaeon]|nr:hypothetical protein [Candidatus Pacearchaeota archaeon]
MAKQNQIIDNSGNCVSIFPEFSNKTICNNNNSIKQIAYILNVVLVAILLVLL